MKLLRTTAFTAALMTAAVMSLTSPALAQDWGWGWRGGGWVPGASVGALATRAVVGNPAARNYGYGYGYPAYSYGSSYSYPAQARLAWWGWPGLVTAGAAAHGYWTGYNYPAYAYGYGSGYGYPASGYVYHPVIGRHITSRPHIRRLYAGAGARRHWQ